MKMGYGGSVRRDLGRLFDGQSVAGLGEAQLLDRFVERRDEPAFEALVARHGPMVLGVCRRLLADPLDVEDAFQATFLIFIRRAGSIQGRDRLAPWLFGVARKVASRTRSDLARRRTREGSGAVETALARDGLDRELNQALLEEIDRLPDSLREPIVLCCVEGLSYDEAATRMQSTAPAVRGRLARGRERLRERLTRRGFAPSVVGVGGLFAAEAVSAAVPLKLLSMTTIQFSKAGTFPAGVEILAEGVIRTMIVTKSKFLAAALLTCGIAGSGVGLYAQKPGPADSDPATVQAPAVPVAPLPPTIPTTTAPTVSRMVEVVEVNEAGEVTRRLVEEVTDPTPGQPPSENPPLATAPQTPNDDRLDKLEKKLDRVLQALERNGEARPVPTNVPLNTTRRAQIGRDVLVAPPATVLPPPSPPDAPQPPAISRDIRRDRERLNNGEMSYGFRDEFQPTPLPAPGQNRAAAARPAPSNSTENRIDALEQKLANLADRIASIERRLNTPESKEVRLPNPGSDDDIPPPGSKRSRAKPPAQTDDKILKEQPPVQTDDEIPPPARKRSTRTKPPAPTEPTTLDPI
jgi:RNA polymerase sigma factor (sigma-70 family)